MESVTFGQCVKGAWRDGWRYAKRRPIVLLAIFVLAWLAFPVEVALTPTNVPPFRLVAFVPYSLFELARMAAFAILVVQAMRFVLLGEPAIHGTPFSRDFWRYLGFMFGLGVVLLVVLGGVVIVASRLIYALDRRHLLAPGAVPLLFAAGTLIAAWLVFFIYLRLSLLGAHVATGHTIQVRAAWADTRGHCWRIGLTQTVAVLPLLALTAALSLTYGLTRQHGLASVAAAGGGAVQVATLCISAACSAWLYRRYAGRLLSRSTP